MRCCTAVQCSPLHSEKPAPCVLVLQRPLLQLTEASAEQTETLTITASVSWSMSCDQVRVRNTVSEWMPLLFFHIVLFICSKITMQKDVSLLQGSVSLSRLLSMDPRSGFFFSQGEEEEEIHMQGHACQPAGLASVHTQGEEGLCICVCVRVVCVTSLQRSMSGHGQFCCIAKMKTVFYDEYHKFLCCFLFSHNFHLIFYITWHVEVKMSKSLVDLHSELLQK